MMEVKKSEISLEERQLELQAKAKEDRLTAVTKWTAEGKSTSEIELLVKAAFG
jgi:hypothetical protein